MGSVVRRLLGLGLTFALIPAAGIAAAATPEVVLNDPAVVEQASSASDGYLVWSANSDAHPNRFNSYVMADGGDPVRVNPEGTRSFAAAIDDTTVAYEEAFDPPHVYVYNDLRFYDTVTEERTPAPNGVNTPRQSEHRPSLSGDWLLFTRTNFRAREGSAKVVLFNLSTSTPIVLAKLPRRTRYLVSDQVNGNRIRGNEHDDAPEEESGGTGSLKQKDDPAFLVEPFAGSVLAEDSHDLLEGGGTVHHPLLHELDLYAELGIGLLL